MQRPSAADRDEEAAPRLDPQAYVEAADRALANGRRDDAIALIAKAYLAFDLLRLR